MEAFFGQLSSGITEHGNLLELIARFETEHVRQAKHYERLWTGNARIENVVKPQSCMVSK